MVNLEREMTWTIKIASWFKIPAAVFLVFSFLTPPKVGPRNQELLNVLSHPPVAIMTSNLSAVEQQEAINANDIKALQHRMDTFEALRIDASLSSMKATIDYDHNLIAAIGVAMLMMLLGSIKNILGFFKRAPAPPYEQ